MNNQIKFVHQLTFYERVLNFGLECTNVFLKLICRYHLDANQFQ